MLVLSVTSILTPWIGVLLKKQIVTQSKNLLLWNPKFNHYVHKIPSLDLYLSNINLVQILLPYFSLRSIFILYPHLCLAV